jgi:hypothetical protein
MNAIDLEALDGFSRLFAEDLLAIYPEWESSMTSAPREAGDEHYLKMEFTAPTGNADDPEILVVTDEGEVTVFFDSYHCHYDWPSYDQSPPPWVDPVAMIAALLAEDIVVMSGWKGDKWTGSWHVERAQALEAPTAPPGTDRVRVRSWKGTFNRDHYVSS